MKRILKIGLSIIPLALALALCAALRVTAFAYGSPWSSTMGLWRTSTIVGLREFHPKTPRVIGDRIKRRQRQRWRDAYPFFCR